MVHIKNSTLLTMLLLITFNAQAFGFGMQVRACVSDVIDNVSASEISIACANTLSRAQAWCERNPSYTGVIAGCLTFTILTILYKKYIAPRTIDCVRAAYQQGFTSGNVYAHRQIDNGMRDQKLAYWQGYDHAMAHQRAIGAQVQEAQTMDQEQVLEIDFYDLVALFQNGDVDITFSLEK